MTLVPVATQGRARPPRPEDWMLLQLPVEMVQDDFFANFVRIFQELGTRLLEDADNIDHVFDRNVAPPEMVRWMASWIGMTTLDDTMPHELQRRIAGVAADTLVVRGTRAGLEAYLELICGDQVVVEEGGGVWPENEMPQDTAWVDMHTPGTGQLALDDFVRVVRDEVPAHVRIRLFVGDTLVWQTHDREGHA